MKVTVKLHPIATQVPGSEPKESRRSDPTPKTVEETRAQTIKIMDESSLVWHLIRKEALQNQHILDYLIIADPERALMVIIGAQPRNLAERQLQDLWKVKFHKMSIGMFFDGLRKVFSFGR